MDEGEITPLGVLLTVMREKWAKDDKPGAIAIARMALAYAHPRPKAVDEPSTQPAKDEPLTNAELLALARHVASRQPSAPPD